MKPLPPKPAADLPEMPLEPGDTDTGPTDFKSLMSAPDLDEAAQRKRPIQATDFRSLVGDKYGRVEYTQKRSATDRIIDGLSPVMVFLMVYAVIYFLLDVRYVVTAVHDPNLRFVMFAFVMGVVALNRLIATEGSNESFLYVAALGGAIAMYTFSAQVYEVGAFTGPWLRLTPGSATLLNLVLVAFIWWLVNRLTHECCVDENRAAGDVGILTGTARRLQQAMKGEQSPRPVSTLSPKKKVDLGPMYVIEAYDPTEGPKKKAAPAVPTASTADRLAKRHPGMSIFYFSVPVMIIFALGLRMVQHGGERWIAVGKLYMGIYTFAALMLLMLTSLGQLREYFRTRKIAMPAGIGWFWLGLGLVMIAMVMVGAMRLPMPPLPPVAHVEEHIRDPWDRNAPSFNLIVDSRAQTEIIQESRAVELVGNVVLGIFGLFLLYGALRGLGALAAYLARQRHVLPPFLAKFFDWLDRFLTTLTQPPKLPERKRRVRIQRDIATSRKYKNTLSDPETGRGMTVNNHVEYAYQALCALAYDLGVPRRQDQTPYEFIRSFPKELNALREEAIELTRLYVLAAYSPLTMDEKVTDRLRRFWITYGRIRNRIVR
ncbi:MAG: DUF4129 domain-containing protein [Candidatus Hydrogenedentes bacterium]|nr:DUF4129 domain-containing protein [Candidatus Hydrogenedentota bacterium]